MLKALCALIGIVVIAAYGYADFRGLELSRTKQGFVPKGRGTQGSTGRYWYGGYRGGK
jgi:hypothetical protein